VKLEGTLALFPLPELIEMVIYSSVTGVLNIYVGLELAGTLYFRDGVLYHVERDQAAGIQALAELLELNQANFAFVSDVTSETESLWGDLNQHLQSAGRLAARWRQLRAYVPSMDLIPLLLVDREAALRRIGPAHYAILPAIDGQANLRQIAASLGWAEIDLAEAIVQMSVDGMLELRSVRPAPTAPAAAEATLKPTRPQGGLFDRVRTQAAPKAKAAPKAQPAQPAANPAEPAQTEPLDTNAQEELILKLLRG
jgi:hypothetical protein